MCKCQKNSSNCIKLVKAIYAFFPPKEQKNENAYTIQKYKISISVLATMLIKISVSDKNFYIATT